MGERFFRHFVTIATIGVVLLIASAALHVSAAEQLRCIAHALRGC
jgi:hypothetical protein